MVPAAKEVRAARGRAQSLRGRLSFPGEHGAYLTLLGAAVAALLQAPAIAPVLAVILVVSAAFLARGPLDRAAAGLPLRAWDRGALALLASTWALGLDWLSTLTTIPLVVLVGGFSAALVVASALAKQQKRQRDPRLEAIALAGIGASAGLAAFIGGVPLAGALTLGLIFAVHAGTSVLAVRPALGKRGPFARRDLAYAAVAACALACVALGHPWAALALVPRLVLLVWSPKHPTAKSLGWRETAGLAAVIALG